MEMLPVPGWPGYYASDEGRVYSTHSPGNGASPTKGALHELQQSSSGRGYRKVNLAKNKTCSRMLVHRIVCLAFHGEPTTADGNHVRHLDGDKTNNQPANLAWGTRRENGRDAVRLGESTRGTRNAMARLTSAKVAEIRARASAGETQRDLARIFGVSQGNISMIVNRITWPHI